MLDLPSHAHQTHARQDHSPCHPPAPDPLVEGLERGFTALGLLAACSMAAAASLAAHGAQPAAIVAASCLTLLACAALGLLEVQRVRRARGWLTHFGGWRRPGAPAVAGAAVARLAHEAEAAATHVAGVDAQLDEFAASADQAASAALAVDSAAAALAGAVERTGVGAEAAARAAARMAQLAFGLGQGVEALSHEVAALADGGDPADILAALRAEAAAMRRRVVEMQRAVEAQHEFGQALAHGASLQGDTVHQLIARLGDTGDAVTRLRTQAATIQRSFRPPDSPPPPTPAPELTGALKDG